MRTIISIATTTILAAGLVACGSARGSTGPGTIQVVTAFYPLEEAVTRVGDDRVTVTDLTPPGVEPHDLELTPSQLGAVADADMIFYLGGGFQPAVEDAVSNAQGIRRSRAITVLTSPTRSANAASTRRPVSSRSIAWTWPIWWVSFTVEPPNG